MCEFMKTLRVLSIRKFASFVAILVVLFSSSFTFLQAASTKVMTYNIRITGITDEDQENWLNTRRWNIFEAVQQNLPDFVGFQEARSITVFRRTGEVRDQQGELGELFEGTQWTYLRYDDPDVPPYSNSSDPFVDAVHNKNPIAVNTDRFTVVDAATTLVKWTDVLSTAEWNDFFDLHIYFHGWDTNGDGVNDRAHHFDPIRHVNWVVADDTDGRREVILNTHYETFPGEDEYGTEESAVKWARFIDYVNRSFTYTSQRLVEIAAELRATYNADGTVLMGDFEVGEEEDVTLEPFTDGGYLETWWSIEHTGGPQDTRRYTGGVDHIYAKSYNVIASFYDSSPEYTGRSIASDHKPLLAEIAFPD